MGTMIESWLANRSVRGLPRGHMRLRVTTEIASDGTGTVRTLVARVGMYGTKGPGLVVDKRDAKHSHYFSALGRAR